MGMPLESQPLINPPLHNIANYYIQTQIYISNMHTLLPEGKGSQLM